MTWPICGLLMVATVAAKKGTWSWADKAFQHHSSTRPLADRQRSYNRVAAAPVSFKKAYYEIEVGIRKSLPDSVVTPRRSVDWTVRPRLYCAIPTVWNAKGRQRREEIMSTWGPRCDRIRFFVEPGVLSAPSTAYVCV